MNKPNSFGRNFGGFRSLLVYPVERSLRDLCFERRWRIVEELGTARMPITRQLLELWQAITDD